MIVSMQYLCDCITVKYGNCQEIVLYFPTKQIPKLVEALWSLFNSTRAIHAIAVCVVWTRESVILSAMFHFCLWRFQKTVR